MDLVTSLAVNVLLNALADKKQFPKIRRAVLKVFKVVWANFSQDADFRKVVFSDTTEP